MKFSNAAKRNIPLICILLTCILLLLSCSDEIPGEDTATQVTKETDNTEDTTGNITDTQPNAAEDNNSVVVISYNIAYYESSNEQFNLAYEGQSAEDYTIAKRSERLKSLVNHYKPDILMLQEVNHIWWEYIISGEDSLLNTCNYLYEGNVSCFGNHDGRGNTDSELYNLVLYNRDRFERQDGGSFWLSDTPEAPGTSGSANLERLCTYVQLKDNVTGASAVYTSTHLVTTGTSALGSKHLSQTRNLLKNIEQIAGDLPVIMCGDYNMSENSKYASNSYSYIIKRQFLDAQYSANERNAKGTVRSWGRQSSWQAQKAIDHCFYRNATAELYKVLYDTFDKDNNISDKISDVGKNYDLSDHLGLYIRFSFGN